MERLRLAVLMGDVSVSGGVDCPYRDTGVSSLSDGGSGVGPEHFSQFASSG